MVGKTYNRRVFLVAMGAALFLQGSVSLPSAHRGGRQPYPQMWSHCHSTLWRTATE